MKAKWKVEYRMNLKPSSASRNLNRQRAPLYVNALDSDVCFSVDLVRCKTERSMKPDSARREKLPRFLGSQATNQPSFQTVGFAPQDHQKVLMLKRSEGLHCSAIDVNWQDKRRCFKGARTEYLLKPNKVPRPRYLLKRVAALETWPEHERGSFRRSQ